MKNPFATLSSRAWGNLRQLGAAAAVACASASLTCAWLLGPVGAHIAGAAGALLGGLLAALADHMAGRALRRERNVAAANLQRLFDRARAPGGLPRPAPLDRAVVEGKAPERRSA